MRVSARCTVRADAFRARCHALGAAGCCTGAGSARHYGGRLPRDAALRREELRALHDRSGSLGDYARLRERARGGTRVEGVGSLRELPPLRLPG